MSNLKILAFFMGSICYLSNTHAGFLTNDDIRGARTLAKATTSFEEVTGVARSVAEEDRKKLRWFTLQKYEFEYMNRLYNFCMANSYNLSSNFGEIAVYRNTVDQHKIFLAGPGDFSDIYKPEKPEPYLSILTYQYIPATQKHDSYFIIESLKNPSQELYQIALRERIREKNTPHSWLVGPGDTGFSEACLKYFLDEFVTTRTLATHVFTDVGEPNIHPLNYFSQYGFNNEDRNVVNGHYECPRGMRYPYHWIKK